MTPLHKMKTSTYYMHTHWDFKGMGSACDMAYNGCTYF